MSFTNPFQAKLKCFVWKGDAYPKQLQITLENISCGWTHFRTITLSRDTRTDSVLEWLEKQPHGFMKWLNSLRDVILESRICFLLAFSVKKQKLPKSMRANQVTRSILGAARTIISVCEHHQSMKQQSKEFESLTNSYMKGRLKIQPQSWCFATHYSKVLPINR